MKRKLLVWFFFVACVINPAYQSTSIREAAGEKALSKLSQEYYGRDIGTESQIGKEDIQRKDHSRDKEDEVHHFKIFQKAKGVYGGANNLRRPKSHSGSNSLLVKSNMLVSLALTLVTNGLLWRAVFSLF